MRRMVTVIMIGLLAGASTAAWATNYGALAYAQATGSWGVSYDHPTQPAANARALRECGKHAPGCTVVVEFWNLCAAYATGADDAAGWGSGDTRSAAEQRALAACQQRGPCQVRVWGCNSQPEVPAETFSFPQRRGTSCWYTNGHRIPYCQD